MKVLVLNCGSSSVKFQLIETDLETIKAETDTSCADRVHAQGLVEKIGMSDSVIKYTAEGHEPYQETKEIPHHDMALDTIINLLTHPKFGVVSSREEIEAVGHRVVHGAEYFSGSVVVNDEVMKAIERCCDFAPLHNPHNISGIRAAQKNFPHAPQVAVFDTAFHQTMPARAYRYGLPERIYVDYKIRRYGFHGTSHQYVSRKAAQMLGVSRLKLKMVTCHLGNGCSMAAVKNRKCVDTTMGFTPLEGLVMGTRCGDLDPAVVLHLMNKENLDVEGMNGLLNKQSGLKGICGYSDMREILQRRDGGHKLAARAVDVFCYRIKKYIGSYAAAMNGLDAVVFTGGIGQYAAPIREEICKEMDFLGMNFDSKKNAAATSEAFINTDDSRVKILVVPTNEELVIARDTYCAVAGVSVEEE